MTGTPETDPPLTPAQEAAVRRALAEAGGPEPMPEQVAGRLDAVIAGLSAERSGSTLPPGGVPENHPEAPAVVPLDAAGRRRRTRARVLLGVAAAVAVVAVGVGIVNDHGDSSSDTAAAHQIAESDPDRSDHATSAARPPQTPGAEADVQRAQPSMADGLGEPGDGRVAPRRVAGAGPLRTVRVDRLRRDLVALQRATLPRPARADYSGTTLRAPADFVCPAASYGAGYLVGVRYDDKPAVVAFREPMGATQEAEVLACGTGDVLRSTTLATER